MQALPPPPPGAFRKGIVLAGGAGSRLFPMSVVASKQLQPIYDKPMIFYPLSVLMLAGIRDILVISTPHDLPRFRELLGDGSSYGVRLSYAVQPRPEGIAQAFIIGAEFIAGDPVALILGDNVFYGNLDFLRQGAAHADGATVFGYQVLDPERFGVVEFDASGKAISLEEKPRVPRSPYAVPGLYFYDSRVVEMARAMKPSARGELEITDLNRVYLQEGTLKVVVIGRGVAWLDTGTPESLLDASNFIAAIEKRQGLKVGCLEEVALRMGFFTRAQFMDVVGRMPNCAYRGYLERIGREHA